MTEVATTRWPAPVASTPAVPRLGRSDPLLQELWACKAALNAAAGHSVEQRAAHSRAFDLQATLARLRERTLLEAANAGTAPDPSA